MRTTRKLLSGHHLFLAGLLLNLGAVVTTAPGFAHPTDRELRETQANRQRCVADIAAAERVDLARLGMSEAELQVAVTELRQDPPASNAAGKTDPRAEQGLTRWVRDTSGALASVEYELWQGKLFQIRWRLAPHFERPVLNELAKRAGLCFGRADYDQRFEAEPGSSAATLRRIGWSHHGERKIELRQLHPLRGGPVYLSISDTATVREVGAARVPAFPAPDRSGPWWQRSMKVLEPANADERKELGDAFLTLLSQLDH